MPLLLDTAEALCKVSSRGLCARREDGSPSARFPVGDCARVGRTDPLGVGVV